MSLPGNLASCRFAPSDALFDRQVRDDPSVLVALPDGQGRVLVVSIALFHSRTSLVGRRWCVWWSVPTAATGCATIASRSTSQRPGTASGRLTVRSVDREPGHHGLLVVD